MKYDIFKNDKEKADARKALPELVKHPGWKFIVRALDVNIEYLNDELRDKLRTRDFNYPEEASAAQDRIDDLQAFKDLPQTILAENQDDPEEQDDSVYEE